MSLFEQGGGGLGDILSLALEQTGVGAISTPQISLDDPGSLLNAAAGTIDNSLLSSDIGSLTEGLFTSLSGSRVPSPCRTPPRGYDQRPAVNTSVPVASASRGYPSTPPMNNNGLGQSTTAVFSSQRGGDLGLPFPDNIDLNELFSDNDSTPGSAVPNPPISASIPRTGGPVPFQATLDDLDIFDEDLSNLLNDTGSEYLESITGVFDAPAYTSQPPIPASGTSTLSHYPASINTNDTTRSLLDPNMSFGRMSAYSTSPMTTSTMKFNVGQVTRPMSMAASLMTPTTFNGQLLPRGGMGRARVVPPKILGPRRSVISLLSSLLSPSSPPSSPLSSPLSFPLPLSL